MRKLVLTKRSVILSGVALSSIGVTSYVLKGKNRKDKLMNVVKEIANKVQNIVPKGKQHYVIKKAGHPDPHDVGDNTMVSEGAMYAVQFYDQKEK